MNKKEKLRQLRLQRAAFAKRYAEATTNEEMDQIDLELRALDSQIGILEQDIAAEEGAASEEGTGSGAAGEDPAARNLDDGGVQTRGARILGTFGAGNIGNADVQQRTENGNPYGTMEYRIAFRNYIEHGTPIPEQFRPQVSERDAEFTLVGNVAAVIPTTIMNRFIEDLTVEGAILNRVTQTNYQGGVKIPLDEINPTVHWLDATETPSEEQKAASEVSVSFAYHTMEIRVSVGILAATVSLDMFERHIEKKMLKAAIREYEKVILSGNGNGKPKGITTYAKAKAVEFTAANIGTVKQWASVEAELPEAYEAGAAYVMAKSTWEKYLNGMTDSTGQKIGLGKINEKGQKILNGRPVITSDQFKSYDAASNGDVFGCLVDLSEYMLNTNLAMYYKRYWDENDNKFKHKILSIVDGQLAAGEDKNGKLVGAGHLILLKKKTE